MGRVARYFPSAWASPVVQWWIATQLTAKTRWILNPLFVVGTLTILGALLRGYHLGFKSIWLDEALLYWISNGSLSDVISENAMRGSLPPLFPILLNQVMRLGESEAILRSISLVAGVLSIPATYWLAVQFLPRFGGYLATLLVSVAPSQVAYSQHVREYSLTFLLATLMILVFISYLRSPSRKSWVALAITWSVAIATQYGLAVLFLGLNVIYLGVLVTGKPHLTSMRDAALKWGLAQLAPLAVIGLVFQTTLAEGLEQGRLSFEYLDAGYWNGSLTNLLRLSSVNTIGVFNFAFPEATLVLFLVSIGIYAALRSSTTRIAVALLVIPFLIAFSLAVARLYPYLGTRQSMYLTPVLFLFCAFGLVHLARIDKSKVAVIVAVSLLTFSGLTDTISYLRSPGPEELRSIAAILDASSEDDDQIYVYQGAVPAFSYYYRREADWIPGEHQRGNVDSLIDELRPLTSGSRRLWIVMSHCYSSECDLVKEYVSGHRILTEVATDEGAWLYLATSDQ